MKEHKQKKLKRMTLKRAKRLNPSENKESWQALTRHVSPVGTDLKSDAVMSSKDRQLRTEGQKGSLEGVAG